MIDNSVVENGLLRFDRDGRAWRMSLDEYHRCISKGMTQREIADMLRKCELEQREREALWRTEPTYEYSAYR